MKNENLNREERALKMISRAVIVIIAIYIMICTVSFIIGKTAKYDEKIDLYKREMRGDKGFTNIETLRFLKTDEVIKYQDIVSSTLDTNQDIGKYQDITILDTITYSKESNLYEWFFVLDDKKGSIFSNTYSKTDGTFSVYEYVQDTDIDSAVNNASEEFADDPEADDETYYISGSIENVAGINPDISGAGSVSKKFSDEENIELIEKLRSFLNETKNNRRKFTLNKGSIKDTDTEITFVLEPEVKLKKNNKIKATYDKREKVFEYEYTD